MKADAKTVSRLLKTARGQIDGILKMIDEDRYCVDVSNQLMATASILKKANIEVLKAHLHACVKESFETGNEADREKKIAEMIGLLEKNTK
jgi:DNA-binding FrmR family transcriptional regulator